MVVESESVLTIIGIVAGIVGSFVAPLYILIIRLRSDMSAGDVARSELAESQARIEEKQARLSDDMGELEQSAKLNAERSESNQRHLHQILVGDFHTDADADEMDNPHYRAEFCPLSDECPWHPMADPAM